MNFKSKTYLGIIALGSALLFNGCSSLNSEKNTVTLTYEQLRSYENTLGTNWYQTSGEAKALYIQGYNIATLRLKEHLKHHTDKPYSIVLDLDETVLDNSPYQAQNITQGTSFTPESWNEWVKMAVAEPVPGAKEFLNFADKNKVKIYYISDRTVDQLDDTIKNLKDKGIPVQSKDSVLLKSPTDKSGKNNRRKYVMEHTNLIMLFGDNLSDFTDFSKKSITERNKQVEELQKEFGDKFIILPNPMYGAFESAIYGGKHLDAKGQSETRLNSLVDYSKLK